MNADAVFEAQRPRLLGLAYRMLGVYAEAEDVVQETWIRWNASTDELERPAAWLTTVATRIALDRLRAGKRRRPGDRQRGGRRDRAQPAPAREAGQQLR